MPYQSFEDSRGDSDSEAKLQCIKMPLDLRGNSVLDIGCNEGFFCKAALDRGASRVVGIDANKSMIVQARKRIEGAVFLSNSWWSLPDEKFDLILFLSAIHYESRQRELLDYIALHLKPDGLLILEAGVEFNWSDKDWKLVQRHDGILRFPTLGLLADDLLQRYVVRTMGPSVRQTGDPQDRHVLHCRLKKPTVLCIAGASGTGKSSFSRLLAVRGLRTIHTDVLVGMIGHQTSGFTGGFFEFIRDKMKEQDIFQFMKQVAAAGKQKDLAKILANTLSKDSDLTVIEGYCFSDKAVLDAFCTNSRDEGFVVICVNLD